MINIDKLDKISYTNKIMQMYEELNTEIVKDILKRVKSSGDFNSFTKHQIKVLARNGGKEIFKNALIKTNKLSKSRKIELLNLFEQIVKEDMIDYKPLYEYKDIDFRLTTNQIELINTMATLTDKQLQNFTKTIAFSSQKEFVDAMDNMYKQVASGGIDINTAYRQTTNDLASKGITLKMKDGNNRSIEAAVRQNITYGIKQTTQLVEDDLAKELGADGVQINITPNCRPEHQVINGQIFSLDYKNKKYPYFKKKYRDLLDDFGCQHYTSPYIIGVSEPIYTKRDIEKANSRVINYKGEQIPYYEATQKQRALERTIRNAKKTYISSPTNENKLKINKAQQNMRNYINETGLERQYDREYYAGYNS